MTPAPTSSPGASLTASDLRLVMSIVKAITDLERIGDETTRIAKMLETLARCQRGDPLPELTDMMERCKACSPTP